MRCAVQVGVAIYIIKARLKEPAQVLMLHHKADGRWRVPGGGREPLEDLEEAARRELFEEVGIDAPPGLLHCFMYDITNHPQNGEWLSFHFVAYCDEHLAGQAQNVEPRSHDGITWMSIADALNGMKDHVFSTTVKGLLKLQAIANHWS